MATHKGQLDTTIEIVTPENIAFQYRVAGPFRRLVAWLIDLAIRTFALGALAVALIIMFALLGFSSALAGMGVGTWLVIYFVVDCFYGGLFETFMNGQTPGKRMMQIRVISDNGQPINGWQAVLRNLMRFVDAWPVLDVTGFISIPTYQLALVTMACNKRFQRLGDLICGTMVVVEERHQLYGVARINEPAAIELAADLPANFVAGRSLARALSAYVQKRPMLGWARRTEIARHLADPLRVKFGLPPNMNPDLLLCALYHHTFIAERLDQTEGTPFQASAAPTAVGANAPRAMTIPAAATQEPAPASVP